MNPLHEQVYEDGGKQLKSLKWIFCARHNRDRCTSFSTLQAGRVAATARYPTRPGPRLSFSTLQAGRVAATQLIDWLKLSPTSFSTLQAGRVAATSNVADGAADVIAFQYPPSGSSRCNDGVGQQFMSAWLLSVPSKRVESLQPPDQAIMHELGTSFSTLQAGRVAATRPTGIPV